MKKKQSIYNTSQPILYGALRRGWGSAITHLPAFTAFAAAYTAVFMQAQLTAVDEAENMKTAAQLQAEINKARIALSLGKAAFFEAFQMLKRYIGLTYKSPLREVNLAEAGGNYYRKAQGDNWPALSNLLKASGDYIVSHQAQLTADNKMPVAFVDDFLAKINGVYAANKTWNQLQEVKPTDLSEKIAANNALYTSLIDMFGVGRQIFAKSPVKKDFTFTQVCKAVRGSSGIAGLRGAITSSDTGLGLQGVIITSADGRYTATTNKNGRYHIKQVLAGTYSFDLQMVGYTSVIQSITIRPGVTRNFNSSLMPLTLLKTA